MFVDTAVWVAAADSSDTASSAVREARDQWLSSGGVLTTTDYVIDETLTTVRFLDGSARLRIESIDETRRERARWLFFGYRDKEFSFTDCCSFVLMRELRIRRALTLDHHFRQMGFEVIP